VRRFGLDEVEGRIFDVAIVGGGITGASTAREAALRGLSTVLVEKGDFASGTSSRSTKLLHGGVRYLERYEFRLVRESCRERELMLKLAPHSPTSGRSSTCSIGATRRACSC
jgi:glycerol-3-phosphate dehydrogenase